jgi:hypothetical protein
MGRVCSKYRRKEKGMEDFDRETRRKRQIGRPRHRLKWSFKKLNAVQGLDCSSSGQGLVFHEMRGISSITEKVPFQEGLFSMELSQLQCLVSTIDNKIYAICGL